MRGAMETEHRSLQARAASAFDVLLEIVQAAADARGPSPIASESVPDLVVDVRRLLLRLAFVSLAEHRDMLPRGEGSLAQLFGDLEGSHPADGRSGAFTQMLDRSAVAVDRIGGAPSALPHLESARGHVPDRLTRALLLALLPEGPRSLAFAGLEVEQLGSMYEALLASSARVTAEPTAVVRRRGPIAGADIPIGLGSLLGERGRARATALRAMGVDVGPGLAHRVATAEDVPSLFEALQRKTSPRFPEIVAEGRLVPAPAEDRRRSGSHYTSRALAKSVASKTISPLVPERPSSDELLALRLCDPSMGSGAFLIAACDVIAERLGGDPRSARRRVATTCLYGIDRDRLAVELAKASLWLFVGDASLPLSDFDAHLVHGDALVEEASHPFALRWTDAFADVLEPQRSGFDAFVGNPPWVSFVGRAAQPLEPRVKKLFRERYASFAGYRNLQGLFIERCASLLRPGGRLGLVVPSSMSEQSGYAPTRLAHDRLCVADPSLPDIGEEAFAGVFQPCMVLLSTRLERPRVVAGGRWPVERRDLDEVAAGLLEKLDRPPLPASLFGERGLQSSGEDLDHLQSSAASPHAVPLRAGIDVQPFRRLAPSYFADRRWFGARLRDEDAWRKVKVLVRQTAAFPIAARSDGLAFRNSLLAVFDDLEHPPDMLVAYLNSTPIRWLHYARHRDARQGMPQVKVGHLRSIPRLDDPRAQSELCALGKALSEKNEGIDEDARRRIDDAVSRALGLDEAERAVIEAFARRFVPRHRERGPGALSADLPMERGLR